MLKARRALILQDLRVTAPTAVAPLVQTGVGVASSRRKSSRFLLAAALPFAPVAAAAQTAANPEPTAPPTQAEQPAPADEATAVGDIVVTAQRRSERLSKVPISISAFNGETLAKTGVTDTRTLTQITPGLNFQSFGSGAQPVIRGIGSTGSSLGDASNVAIYVDGVYSPFQPGNFLNFVDLERIEVLKGPQGTLFGRNAAGGAISITTLKPSFDFSGRLGLSYGRFDEVEATSYVTGALIEDKLAFNFSGDYFRNDGFRYDINLDKRLGYTRSYSLRSKLLLKASDATEIQLTGFYRHFNDLTTFGNQPLDGNTLVRASVPDILLATKPNTSSLGVTPINKVTSYGGNLRITGDLGGVTLTSITSVARNTSFVFTDSDLTLATFSQSRINYRDDILTQELTFATQGSGPLSVIGGVFYFHEDGVYDIRSFGGRTVFVAQPALTSGSHYHAKVDSYAIFSEATYQFSDRFAVIGGLRYSRDKPRYTGYSISAAGVIGPRLSPSDKFDSVTPRLSLRYALTDRLNLYGTYSKGFKSGVFNAAGLNATAVDPEKVEAFEVGLKGSPARAFSFDLAAYHYDYKDLQVQSFGQNSLSAILQNAASAEIYGFEANATILPFAGFTLRGGVAYTHGDYQSFTRAQAFRPTTNAAGVPIGGNTQLVFDAGGTPLIRTPRFQGNLTASYEARLGSSGSLLVSVTGSHTSTIRYDFAGNYRQKPFDVVNANLSYTTPDEKWRATLFGTNILDETYLASVLVSALSTSVTYARPATYGVRLEYLF